MKKGREKGERKKKKKVITLTFKYLYEAKKSTKTGKNFRGGWEMFFWLDRIYTPARDIYHEIKTIRLYKPFS